MNDLKVGIFYWVMGRSLFLIKHDAALLAWAAMIPVKPPDEDPSH